MNVQEIYEKHKGDPTWVPGILNIISDIMQLELAVKVALAAPEIGPELASKVIAESSLNKAFPNICSTLLASLCLNPHR